MHKLRIIVLLLVTCHVTAVTARQAPGWTAESGAGGLISLSDYRGKVVLLHFWASWCPYCRKLEPGLSRLYDRYQREGLEVVGVNFRENAGIDPQQLLKKRGHRFTTVIHGAKIAEAYGVKGTPTTFVIDRYGRAVWASHTSNPDDAAMQQAVRQALAAK